MAGAEQLSEAVCGVSSGAVPSRHSGAGVPVGCASGMCRSLRASRCCSPLPLGLCRQELDHGHRLQEVGELVKPVRK